MRIDLDWTADSRDPLFLRAPIAPALPVARDDVGAVLKGLDALGYYDAEAGGIPPRSASVVHDAIERFQADHGLARDGVMQPDGPTLRTLNQIFEARRGEKFWRAQEEENAQRQYEGRPSSIVLTGQNNAIVGAHPAADASAKQRRGALFAQAENATPMSPQLERRTNAAIESTRRYREPPSRARIAPESDSSGRRLPSWLVMERGDPPQFTMPRGRAEYWAALQQRQQDDTANRRIGPRLAEALQTFFDGEGGAQQDRDPRSTAFAGINQGTVDRVLRRLEGTDPELAAQLRNPARRNPRDPAGIPPARVTPAQWALILRDDLNEALRRAGGVQAIEDIGNAAPDRGSRELSAVMVTYLLRGNGVEMIRDIQENVNVMLGRLTTEERNRIGDLAPRSITADRMFGASTRDAIVALARLGYADTLRMQILTRYRYHPDRRISTEYDRDRVRWLQNLRFPAERDRE